MKLHLPTALRRALLAITALLSPAVVTTTIATATLAAITAPAMAEDLTITETQITKDITYNNVTVSSSSAHLYSTTKNANFTAGTLTVDSNGKLVVGSTSFDGSSRFNFYASKFEIETGGSITFVENPQVYATDTLYDLLVGVKQDDSIRVHNTNVYGAGHKDLTSEFLTSKIRHHMVQTNCYLTLTSGDLAINSSFEDDLLTFWVYVGDGKAENGEAKATIADGVEIAHTDTNKKNRLYGLAIYRDGSLNVGKGNNALTLANCDIGGKMVSNRDIVFSNTYFRASNGDYKYSEADVTVNGKITFANTNSSTTIVYGSLTANGEIVIEGNNYIKLNSSTVLNLGGKINNSGSLTLGGTINLNAANFTHSTASSFDDVAYNGYEVTTTTYLGVITGTGTVTGRATWKVGGNTATYNAGDVTVTTTDKSTYRVSSGNVDLSTALESNDTNKILLCGGNLVVNTDISSLIPEITTVGGAASTVTINTSLNQNALTATDDKTITLCGTGSYVINGTDLSLGTGIMISDSEWSGTVKTTGATAASGAVNTTGWNNTELNGTTTVNNGATLTLGGNTKLNGLLENNGSVVLGGVITVDPTEFAVGTRDRYSEENDNGYKITDTTYTVLSGNAATGSATWKVGTQSATYENGMVIVDGIEDTAVYYVRNNIVNYGTDVTELATKDTKFSLEGGSLKLGKELVNDQGIIAKTAGSSVEILSNTTLKSNQLSVVSGGSVELSGNGAYEITGTELSLGSDVSVGSGWSGTVKTAAATTVSSNLDTTSWKNTELNGTTTVNSGVTLTLGGTTTLKGKIENNGTLELSGNIAISTSTYADGDVLAIDPHYQQGSSAERMTSGFKSTKGMEIQVIEGNAANATGANWSVTGVTAGSYTFDATSGKLHVVTDKSSVSTEFYINDDITYVKEGSGSEIFTNINGKDATGLVLNGGNLVLSTDLLNDTMKITANKAGSVEIGNNVNLYASQLDASVADVSLTGKGAYTMADGANTLGEGVNVGTDWTGTVKLTGTANALKLSSLGNALSSIDLGSFNHTLADGDHEIDSALVGSGSLTLNKGKLTLNGDCSNWSGDIIGQVALELTEGGTIGGNITVDSLHIEESSTTFEGELTTKGTITVSKNATLSLSQNGNTTLGGKITNSGTLVLGGNIDVLSSMTHTSKATFATTGDASDLGTESGSGFASSLDVYSVVEGNSATGSATWTVDGKDAHYDSGKVSLLTGKDTSTWWMNTAADYSTISGNFVTGSTTTLALNTEGGTLQLDTNPGVKLVSKKAATIEICKNMNLNAAQLDASAADVTLSGKGSYTLEDGVNTLGERVNVGTGWSGTVYTGELAAGTAQNDELNINALGNRQSTVYLGARPMRRSMPRETVLKSLTADGVGNAVVPGALTVKGDKSTANNLEVQGMLTLGTADSATTLEATGVLSTQGITLGNIDSSASAATLNDTALDLRVADSELLKLTGGSRRVLTLVTDYTGATTLNGKQEVLGSNGKMIYSLAWQKPLSRAAAGSMLVLTANTNPTYVQDKVGETVSSYTHNGRAGLSILNDAYAAQNPQSTTPGSALAELIDAVDAGKMTDECLAAVAGASTAALGMALSGDVERQLSAIRNRSLAGNDAATVTLVDEKAGMVPADAPARFFAWVNAEGNRAEQNDDSTAAGYTLTSWGGTLGAGMQVNDKLTLGLALTAMYGDLQSDAPDSLKGDMDTTYVSAFARYNRGKWSHAFIGTVGTMEADYKRTVSHAAGSYNASGDTDGTAFGLMYEVSRGVQLSNRSTLSPVFNISYRHTEVDSYSESGADAALNVGKQSLDTVTAGAGARYAAVVGQRMLNRACGFEARALVKYDLGDRQSTPSTGFINRATRAGIESAELGAFGVELGAGISVPVRTGSIFADAAVELRSDYTNFNATVGYRVQF